MSGGNLMATLFLHLSIKMPRVVYVGEIQKARSGDVKKVGDISNR